MYYLKAIEKKNFQALNNLLRIYWNNSEQQNALDLCERVLQNKDFLEKEQDLGMEVLIFLLVNEQYNFTLSEFKKEGNLLMKYMLPIYYVVAWYLKDELPGEYEKAGNEVKQTVDEIIETIEKIKSEQKK